MLSERRLHDLWGVARASCNKTKDPDCYCSTDLTHYTVFARLVEAAALENAAGPETECPHGYYGWSACGICGNKIATLRARVAALEEEHAALNAMNVELTEENAALTEGLKVYDEELTAANARVAVRWQTHPCDACQAGVMPSPCHRHTLAKYRELEEERDRLKKAMVVQSKINLQDCERADRLRAQLEEVTRDA